MRMNPQQCVTCTFNSSIKLKYLDRIHYFHMNRDVKTRAYRTNLQEKITLLYFSFSNKVLKTDENSYKSLLYILHLSEIFSKIIFSASLNKTEKHGQTK